MARDPNAESLSESTFARLRVTFVGITLSRGVIQGTSLLIHTGLPSQLFTTMGCEGIHASALRLAQLS